MSNKHTPGPWTIVPHSKTAAIRQAANPLLSRSGCNIAVIDYQRGEEALANARLIAAAPELLEALWAMVTSFHAVEYMEPHMQQSAAMARAAIAKATGAKP